MVKKIIAVLFFVSVASWFYISEPEKISFWPHVQIAQIRHIQFESMQSDGQSQNYMDLWYQEGGWKLADKAQVKAEYVDRLLHDLLSMQQVRVVSLSRKHDQALGMSDAQVMHVRCFDANHKRLLAVDIGKQGSDLISTYVRIVGQDAVLAVNKILLWQVRRSLSGWLGKS